jgi:hypothetical protein
VSGIVSELVKELYWGACIAHIAEAWVESHVGFAWAYNRLSVKLRKVFLKGGTP